MLFVHGRMVHHRSDGLSMSQVSVSDMDPSWSRSAAPNTPTPDPDPHPPISTHRSQPPPGEADRWHKLALRNEIMSPGETVSVTLAHACVNACIGMV